MEVACQLGGDRRAAASPGAGGSPKASLHVGFLAPQPLKERKEKYLTAKYGQHQMALIRARLAVEMWLCERLTELYGAAQDKELDLDQLLDLEGDGERRKSLEDQLADCPPQHDVKKFIAEVLERAKLL